MLDLDADELPYPAAQLIDDLEHQLVGIVVDAVEELLQFILGQIANDLAEAFVLSSRPGFLDDAGIGLILGRVRLHSNVKSLRLINSALSLQGNGEPIDLYTAES
jgi:hypothetical protein